MNETILVIKKKLVEPRVYAFTLSDGKNQRLCVRTGYDFNTILFDEKRKFVNQLKIVENRNAILHDVKLEIHTSMSVQELFQEVAENEEQDFLPLKKISKKETKNELLKRIIDTKDGALFSKHKKELTKAEIVFLKKALKIK